MSNHEKQSVLAGSCFLIGIACVVLAVVFNLIGVIK